MASDSNTDDLGVPFDPAYVDARQFGAVGDGETDDAAALQKAADAAARAPGRQLFIPAGRYLFGSSITFRCNVECRGTLVKQLKLDPARHVELHPQVFLPSDSTKQSVAICIVDDQDPVALDPTPFYGLRENSFKLSAYGDVPLRDDPSRRVDLEDGGTIVIRSSDFFTSRDNNRGDEYYDRNDCSQLVSPLGDIYPELAFDYPDPPDAPEWP